MIILGKESSRKIQAGEKAPKVRKKCTKKKKRRGMSIYLPATFNLLNLFSLFNFYFSNLLEDYRQSRSSLDLLARFKIHNANLSSKNLRSRDFYI